MNTGQPLAQALPAYKCHKIVTAAKIVKINENWITVETPNGVHFEAFFSNDWCTKHNPQIGGYLVCYSDSYISYSPEDAFESGYSIIQ